MYNTRTRIILLVCLGYSVLQAMERETPEQRLLQAAYQNNLEMVKHCIEQEGVDVNVKCYAGYDEGPQVKKLVFSAFFNVSINEYNVLDILCGPTALQYAAQAGSRAVVKYLLTLPDIELDCVANGPSALHRAILYNNFDSAYELLKAGADYNKASESLKQNIRGIALSKGKKGRRIVQLIDAIELYKPQLLVALEQNNEEKVRLLLQKVPYWVKDHEGNTLLHKVVEKCSPELVGLIVKLDVSAITKQNKQGQTPVNRALAYNRIDLIKLFTKLAYAQPEPVNYSEDPGVAPITCQIL